MTVSATGPADLRTVRRLAILEETIETGMSSFVMVGEALMEVRDSRLYRESYPTFEAYCKGRWGFDRQRGYQLIAAAEVVSAMSKEVYKPTTEAHAAAIAPVLREHGPEVAGALLENIQANNGRITAPAIREAINPEGPRIDDALWNSLVTVIETIEGLTGREAAEIAATVPYRRRAATAKRLRKLGTYLGRIAWTLEGEGTDNE